MESPHGYTQRMEAMCEQLGIPVTDEMRGFWAQMEQHNVDISFRHITDHI